MDSIDPQSLKPRLTDGGEIAFIDVREHGQYGDGHPFFVVSLPYSRLEIDAPRMIPRKSVPVVLVDDNDGVAEKAARRLNAIGYETVSKLEGGVKAWVDAGGRLFEGVNLPSKTFGELIEHAADTPTIKAEELKARQESGEPLVLLDGRTAPEFRKMSIPGAVHCPNAELGHRLPEFVSDETTPVVINCAGRTRSIIGAQGLIAQGYKNPIYALENGTQGWELAGLTLDHGEESNYPRSLAGETLAASRSRADALMAQHAIPKIDMATLNAWRQDDTRSLYVLDVRTPEEYEAGHLPDARHAAGGQLVQATDLWIATRGARIVLTDDTGLRAANTAFWLRQMGHDVSVLADDVSSCAERVLGPEAPVDIPDTLAPPSGDTPNLVDLNPSMTYRKGHISGAQWAIRPRLDRMALSADAEIILMAEDKRMAELAAMDLRDLGLTKLAYLEGGPDDWAKGGHNVEATADSPADADCIDYLFFTHDRHVGNLDSARAYLSWEIELPKVLDEQERNAFTLAY